MDITKLPTEQLKMLGYDTFIAIKHKERELELERENARIIEGEINNRVRIENDKLAAERINKAREERDKNAPQVDHADPKSKQTQPDEPKPDKDQPENPEAGAVAAAK